LNDRYFVLGSLHCPTDPSEIRSELDTIKSKHALRTEIKWEKFPRKIGQYHDGYTGVIHKFVDSPLTYKALIVDTRLYQLNNREFTGGDRGVGYYQFYLTLLFNGIIRHEPVYNTRVYLHTPACKLDGGLTLMEDKINEAATRCGFPEMAGYSCCRVSADDSRTDSMIQLTDILTGMISAIWNGKIAVDTKRRLVLRCSEMLGYDITTPSESRHVDTKFNRWVFKASEDHEQAKKWPALYPLTK